MEYLLPTLPTTVAGWPAYAAFYLLGFGLAGGLLVCYGWRQHYPWQPWLLLVAGTVLALIAGTRVAAGTAADWHTLLAHGHWGTGAPLGRTVLGGMVAAVLALAGLRRWLGFGRRTTDAFALPLVLGLAVQGVGCLLAGCCYGTLLGNGPGLGMRYPAGTEPWAAQVAHGLLPASAAVSLPVQAAPAYQLVLCLAIAAGLLAGRRELAQRPGVALPLALGLFALGRMVLERGRDPLGDVLGSGLWHGLKPVQLGLATAALALLAVTARRWRTCAIPSLTSTMPAPEPPVRNQPLANLTLVVLLLVLPPLLLPGQVTVAETLVLRALLLPVLLLEAIRWGRALWVAGPRPAVLLALGFGLMSQAPAPATPPTSQFAEPARALTVSGGGLTGSSYQLFQDYSTCKTPPANITTFPSYHQRYQAAALGVAYSQRLDETRASRFTLGITGFLGRTNFDLPTGQVVPVSGGYLANAAASHQLLDVNPYVEYSALSRHTYGTSQLRSHLRLGFGLRLGGPRAYDYVVEPFRDRGVGAGFLVEYGAARQIWVHLSDNYGPDAVGNGLFRAGLGTSFGRDRLTLLGGFTVANSNTYDDGWLNLHLFSNPSYEAPLGYFLQARWQATPAWLLEGSATSNFNDMSQLTLGTRYRLPLGAR